MAVSSPKINITHLKIQKCFSALMRDRDELAAALEVRDRIKYDLNTPEREEILSTGDLIIEVIILVIRIDNWITM